MALQDGAEAVVKRNITRRTALKAGGVAAVGLAFSSPLIRTIRPKPAFAGYGSVTTASGGTVFLSPLDDGTIVNYGDDTTPDVVDTAGVMVGMLLTGYGEYRGIAEFDVSGVDFGGVSEAVFRLHKKGGGPAIDLHGYTSTADGAVTFADWDSPSMFLVTVPMPAGEDVPVSVDVTPFIKGLPAGTSKVGFRLIAHESSGASVVGVLEFPPSAVLKIS